MVKIRSRYVVLALALTTTFLGCNAIFGIEKPIIAEGLGGDANLGGNDNGETGDGGDAPTGKSCILTSECDVLNKNYICIFEICSPPCAGDRDCEAGQRCLITKDEAACVDETQSGCEKDRDCPSGNVCVSERCRIDCSADETACLKDQICVAGTCRGQDPTHDSAEIIDPGAKCEVEDKVTCAGVASNARLRCDGEKWVTHEACAADELCDATSDKATCRAIPDECVGRSANESFCDGAYRKTCAANLLSFDQVECDSPQHCNLGQGTKCAACLPNSYQCDDNILKKCNENSTAYEDKKDCTATGQPCSASAGDCTEYFCNPDQKRCTEDDVLEVCNEERSAFVQLDQCDEGLCDSENFECDVCEASTAVCTGGQTVACSADGQTLSSNSCEAATPYCIGAGNCVQCTQASHCSATNDCYDVICSGNSCVQSPKNSGASCSSSGGSVCTGSGACVACVAPANCPAVGECYNRTCSNNACGQSPKPRATICSGGNVCNGAGSCAANTPYAVGEASADGWSAFSVSNDKWWVVPVFVPRTANLQELRLIGASATGQARMAIWADNAGAPGAYHAQTNNFSMASGVVSQAPTANIQLTGGRTYWVGAKFTGGATIYIDTASGTAYSYNQSFSSVPSSTMSPFPTGSATLEPGTSLNFFLLLQDVPQ